MSTHATPIDTDAQSTTTPEDLDAHDEPLTDEESELRALRCPRDGQVLEGHHKIERERGRFECPACRRVWPIWEVFAE